MYNVLEKLRSDIDLDDEDERVKKDGLILILRELHDKIDRLVFEAYGWSQHLSEDVLLANLVTLNHERAAEERRGHVRWLRPDYQIPEFGKDLDKQAAKEEGAQIIADLGIAEPTGRKPSFPTDAVGQTAAVFAALASAGGPTNAAAIAATFRKTKASGDPYFRCPRFVGAAWPCGDNRRQEFRNSTGCMIALTSGGSTWSQICRDKKGASCEAPSGTWAQAVYAACFSRARFSPSVSSISSFALM